MNAKTPRLERAQFVGGAERRTVCLKSGWMRREPGRGLFLLGLAGHTQ